MYNGILNVYKEAGYTSHDVVARLRGILGQKKIGHTGTLDPDAVGVLPVCLGKATRLCDMLTDKSKEYRCVMELGITTDTEDRSGCIISRRDPAVSPESLLDAIKSFEGACQQIPPMYSAVRVNGKKLYELAREGKVIERKPREVYIYSITVLSVDMPLVTMKVSCSKGTYIRSLCRDIGERLGCGACMHSLVRTKVGQFLMEDSLSLEQIRQLQEQELLRSYIHPLAAMFPEYKRITVREPYHGLVHNGNPFPEKAGREQPDLKDEERVLVYDSDSMLIGIYKYQHQTRRFLPVKMFFVQE